MSGSIEGGRKAAQKNLARDPDFYSKIGRKGGSLGNTGGFASLEVGDDGLTGPERASKVGVRGGLKSRHNNLPKVDVTETEEVKVNLVKRLFPWIKF